jgi:diketogulonate reductase-like aldo/keto reductase
MDTRPLGRGGPAVAVIGQGTWQVPTAGAAAERTVAALRLGLDLGLTHVDTAEMYGDGAVETLIARALRGRRAEAFLATKVLPQHASRDGTIAACEQSLRRLRTDHVDLYMIHWPGRHPIDETMGAMERLVEQGKVRHVGVSNFDVDELAAAQRALGRVRLAANQVLYHLGDRGIEHGLLPYCAREGIAVVAYSPFGSGRFPAPRSAGGKVLAAIAARHGRTPHQVALRFLTRDPAVVAIPRATDPAHVRENAAVVELTLDAEDVAAIDRAFLRPPRGQPLGMI